MTSTEIKTIELIVNSEQAKKRLDDLNQRLTVMKQKRDEAFSCCRPRWTKFSRRTGGLLES